MLVLQIVPPTAGTRAQRGNASQRRPCDTYVRRSRRRKNVGLGSHVLSLRWWCSALDPSCGHRTRTSAARVLAAWSRQPRHPRFWSLTCSCLCLTAMPTSSGDRLAILADGGRAARRPCTRGQARRSWSAWEASRTTISGVRRQAAGTTAGVTHKISPSFVMSLAFDVRKQSKADMAYRSRAHRHPAHPPPPARAPPHPGREKGE